MRGVRNGIQKSQIGPIHTMIHKLKIDRDLYMEMLMTRFPYCEVSPIKERELYLSVYSHYLGIEVDDSVFLKKGFVPPRLSTCKKLTSADAWRFIAELKSMLHQTGYKPYDEYGDRPGMAKPAALRKIAAMWAAVTRQKTRHDKDVALNRWLDHHFHISHIRFIEDNQVGKILFTLKAMKAQARTEVG